MGTNYMADIPENQYLLNFANASVPSNVACTPTTQIFVAPQPVQVLSVWWTPYANQFTKASDGTASYRTIQAINGSTDGTGTKVIASKALNTSHASLTPIAWSLTTDNTMAVSEILILSAITAGGDLDDGTIVAAGYTTVAYKVL